MQGGRCGGGVAITPARTVLTNQVSDSLDIQFAPLSQITESVGVGREVCVRLQLRLRTLARLAQRRRRSPENTVHTKCTVTALTKHPLNIIFNHTGICTCTVHVPVRVQDRL